MATDEEKIVHDILDTNWNDGNVPKPKMFYTGEVKHNDTRGSVIKIYLVSTPSRPINLGYTKKKDKPHVTVDIRSSSRDAVLEICDEVMRVLELKRKNPGSGYYLLTHTGKRKVASYTNFHHYVIEAYLSAFNTVT
ncbi:hypothetical protein KAR91_44520 [Candidatus Pacearchaeota archaeon]|nr:hypothetical protein [Candidatus Pacearchaeota archaeon]